MLAVAPCSLAQDVIEHEADGELTDMGASFLPGKSLTLAKALGGRQKSRHIPPKNKTPAAWPGFRHTS